MVMKVVNKLISSIILSLFFIYMDEEMEEDESNQVQESEESE